MDADPKAPAYARHAIEVSAPPETVWSLLSDIDHWSAWHPDIGEARLDGPLAPGSTFRWKSRGTAITSRLEDVTPPRRLAWTGRASGASARHVWTLEPHGEGATVTTEESFNGPIVLLLRFVMQRTLDDSLRAWLERLKSAAEEGSRR